jgi:hypothetical protein
MLSNTTYLFNANGRKTVANCWEYLDKNQSFKIAPTLYSLVLDSTYYLFITLTYQKLADVIDLKQAATLEGALMSTTAIVEVNLNGTGQIQPKLITATI